MTSGFYVSAVGLLFWPWSRSEGTLSIHSIATARREEFYWATVLTTLAVGTAVGDLTGLTLHGDGVVTIVLIVVIAVLVGRATAQRPSRAEASAVA